MDRVIAVDGPSGVGKSSVCKALAQKLGWTYLDTGAMYRTVTLAWLEAGADKALLEDQTWLSQLRLDFDQNHVILNGRDVSKAIREHGVTAKVSLVSAAPLVRTVLTDMQREMAGRKACVLDGRDIGTVVFPNAFLKIFLTASVEVRALRRRNQLGGDRCNKSLDEIAAELAKRDHLDSTREAAPLRKAEDAVEINTDNLNQEEVVQALYQEAQNALAAAEPDPR